MYIRFGKVSGQGIRVEVIIPDGIDQNVTFLAILQLVIRHIEEMTKDLSNQNTPNARAVHRASEEYRRLQALSNSLSEISDVNGLGNFRPPNLLSFIWSWVVYFYTCDISKYFEQPEAEQAEQSDVEQTDGEI